MTHFRKRSPVQAWQFQGQPAAEWPEFVRDFKINTMRGWLHPSLSLGIVILPQKFGPDIQVQKGDWLVLEHGMMAAYRGGDFGVFFENAGPTDEPAEA